MRQQLRITSLALLCCAAAAAFAAAQDAPQRQIRRAAAYSQPTCDDGRGLVVCVDARTAPARKARAGKESLGAISKFAKLAGMFMGRVDAVETNHFKFRFKLEIADAHDFVRE